MLSCETTHPEGKQWRRSASSRRGCPKANGSRVESHAFQPTGRAGARLGRKFAQGATTTAVVSSHSSVPSDSGSSVGIAYAEIVDLVDHDLAPYRHQRPGSSSATFARSVFSITPIASGSPL